MKDCAGAAGADRTDRTDASRGLVVTALGVTQILAWGSSYYLPAVLARPIAGDTGWPLTGLVGGLSLGLLVAGAVAPRVGQAIDRDGGRPVLAFSSVLMAAGLIGIGLAQSLTVYLAAWLLIGIGMGAGLYDAAFSALGRAYGRDARTAIAALTLFGGLASTVCWPLSAWLVETVGWRGTCLAYAGLHLSLALPLHLVAVPRAGADIGPPAPGSGSPRVAAEAHLIRRGQRLVFILLAVVIAAGSAISSVLSVHLLTILQSGGVELASAVALGALIGPAQVGARAIEMALGRLYHPIWTLLASTVLVAAGLLLMFGGVPVAALPLVLYGAGIGIESIARGALPLALFGQARYGTLMGRLALPSLMAQSLAPLMGALQMERAGPGLTLAVLAALSLANVGLTTVLLVLCRKPRPDQVAKHVRLDRAALRG